MSQALSGSGGDFGLYVHWPFCLSKCPYCDFNSHVAAAIDQDRWRRALIAELDRAIVGTDRRGLSSIFFGGGTPSLMLPETVAAVIERATSGLGARPDIEITLEANPTSVEARRFAAYRAAGVNRLSLGVQALDDRALKSLGREHDASEARAAIDTARRHFPRFSFDLIYTRPGQTAQSWREELALALSFAGDHLSLYQLTIEKGTPFHALHRDGVLRLPDEAVAETLFEVTAETMERAGMPAYEISNHASPGQESRHNLVYWRYGDYLGIGPGAHGRIKRGGAVVATRRVRDPNRWLEAVERSGHGTEASETLAARDSAVEALMMGLRLSAGIERARFKERTSLAAEDCIDPRGLARMIEGGFVTLSEHRLAATAKGRRVLNAVLIELLPD